MVAHFLEFGEHYSIAGCLEPFHSYPHKRCFVACNWAEVFGKPEQLEWGSFEVHSDMKEGRIAVVHFGARIGYMVGAGNLDDHIDHQQEGHYKVEVSKLDHRAAEPVAHRIAGYAEPAAEQGIAPGVDTEPVEDQLGIDKVEQFAVLEIAGQEELGMH